MLRLLNLEIEYIRFILFFLFMFIGVSEVIVGGLLGMVENIVNN